MKAKYTEIKDKENTHLFSDYITFATEKLSRR